MNRFLSAAAALVLAACGGGGGGGDSTPSTPTTPTPSTNTSDPAIYSSLAVASLATPNELTAVTHHQLVVGGTTLNYTATVGHMTALSQGTNLPEASFFYVAYTLDGADLNTRPVTFFYNGGPGSATVWLHLGSFGPKRLAVNAPSTTTPQPFALVDNAESLLDKSDLVFVDAVGTGFSEAIAPNINDTFWGVDADAAVFRDFVMRYVAVNSRATSPKFLFGESYGTPRSAVLANLLETAGTSLKGVVLQSSILNYNTNCGIFEPATISCFGFVPSYAAVGAWLDLVQPPEGVAQLPAFTQQVRSFAIGTYDPAVSRWMANHAAIDQGVVATLVADTGMPAVNWFHFNMDPSFFHDNLVPGSVLGFYDGRMVAARGTPLAAEDDPSTTMYDSAFGTTIVSYLADLHYTNGSAYTVLGSAINSWNFHHNGQALPDTVPDLAAAFVRNPKLKVFSANGYHDLVTPFYVTENDITRFNNNPNISVHIYQGGHMTYLDDIGRAQEKADLAAFYAGAIAAKSAEVLPPVIAATKPETPAYPAVTPPAKFETKLRDPALPEALRGIVPTPPTRGKALEAQVQQILGGEREGGQGAAGRTD